MLLLTLLDLQLYLPKTFRQTAKLSQVPLSLPSTATNQLRLEKDGSENIAGGHNGFDTILQDQVRLPQTEQSTASPRSLPPLNGLDFPLPSLNRTFSQRRSNDTPEMPNPLDFSQYQDGAGWPSQRFSINHVQEPNQPLDSNQSHRIAPVATPDSQLNSNADPFRKFISEDQETESRRAKRPKLAPLSKAGQGLSASTWPDTTVGGQGQDKDQL